MSTNDDTDARRRLESAKIAEETLKICDAALEDGSPEVQEEAVKAIVAMEALKDQQDTRND